MEYPHVGRRERRNDEIRATERTVTLSVRRQERWPPGYRPTPDDGISDDERREA
jgi:hypothetical protein